MPWAEVYMLQSLKELAFMKVTAIIPALNEAPTIGDVVDVAVESCLVDEVIVVSDGSRDTTANLARIAGARVIEHLNPLGKGQAMKKAAQNTRADIVLFLDGDLKRLQTKHIEQLLQPVLSGSHEMSIGFLPKGIFTHLQFVLPMISGQRAIKLELFNRIPHRFTRGYMIETAMTRFCRIHKKPIHLSILPGLGVRRKIEKTRIDRALFQYCSMSAEILKAKLLIAVHRLRGKF